MKFLVVEAVDPVQRRARLLKIAKHSFAQSRLSREMSKQGDAIDARAKEVSRKMPPGYKSGRVNTSSADMLARWLRGNPEWRKQQDAIHAHKQKKLARLTQASNMRLHAFGNANLKALRAKALAGARSRPPGSKQRLSRTAHLRVLSQNVSTKVLGKPLNHHDPLYLGRERAARTAYDKVRKAMGK